MSQNVTRLKELLFDRESATLAELQRGIGEVATRNEALHAELVRRLEQAQASEAGERKKIYAEIDGAVRRAGTEEQFRSSVAEVLDGALREAEAVRHDQLSRAMAPLVVKTIKTELRNSQDEMVEALYPITGRLVKTYIASAMKDLMDQINRRLSGGSNPLMLRLRSLATGRSVAELALAETQRLEVAELFLVRRGSGELVQHWPDGPQGSGVPSNSDIHLSGVLTAINDFASQALKEDGGNLRGFALDDYQMYLRASPAYLLAAKCRGSAPAGVEEVLDDEFLRLIEANGKALSASTQAPPPLLSPLATRLEARLDEKQRAIAAELGAGFNPLKALAVLLLLPLAAYAGWALYTGYEAAQVRDFAGRTLAATPQLAGYPTQVEVGYRGHELTLTGLVPTAAAKADLVTRLRDGLPATRVVDRLAVLPNASADLEPQVTSVRRSLAGIEGEAYRSAVRRALTRASRRLDQAVPHLRRLEPELAEPSARTVTKSAGEGLERIAGELRSMQNRLGSGPIDMAQLTALSPSLHAHAERLKVIGAELSALLAGGTGPAEAAHADAAPVDILESAEELGLAAEQVATVAVATAQAASIKLPPAPPPSGPSPRERLESWIRSNAVFFGEGSDFRNQRAAEATIERAAMLIRDAQVLVRVVGYTDERGGQARNTSLSQTRAQRVADLLIERGVPRSLLVVIGRPAGIEISTSVGPQSPNRRVEFELAFAGETGDAQ